MCFCFFFLIIYFFISAPSSSSCSLTFSHLIHPLFPPPCLGSHVLSVQAIYFFFRSPFPLSSLPSHCSSTLFPPSSFYSIFLFCSFRFSFILTISYFLISYTPFTFSSSFSCSLLSMYSSFSFMLSSFLLLLSFMLPFLPSSSFCFISCSHLHHLPQNPTQILSYFIFILLFSLMPLSHLLLFPSPFSSLSLHLLLPHTNPPIFLRPFLHIILFSSFFYSFLFR